MFTSGKKSGPLTRGGHESSGALRRAIVAALSLALAFPAMPIAGFAEEQSASGERVSAEGGSAAGAEATAGAENGQGATTDTKAAGSVDSTSSEVSSGKEGEGQAPTAPADGEKGQPEESAAPSDSAEPLRTEAGAPATDEEKHAEQGADQADDDSASDAKAAEATNGDGDASASGEEGVDAGEASVGQATDEASEEPATQELLTDHARLEALGGASPDKAVSIEMGKAINDESGRHNWYRFTLNDEGPIWFEFSSEYVNQGYYGWTIYLYKENDIKKEMLYSKFYGPSLTTRSSSKYGLPKGTYYVKVAADGTSNLRYSLTVQHSKSDAWEREHNGSMQIANRISLNKSYYGILWGIEPDSMFDDDDWFVFTLKDKTQINITFGSEHDQDQSTASIATWSIYLQDSSGKTIDSVFPWAKDQKDSIVYSGSLSVGTYYLHIAGDNLGGYTGHSTYHFRVSSVQPTSSKPSSSQPSGSQPSSSKTSKPSWQRLWGQGALDTAAAVVRAGGAFADGRGGTVVIATSDGYWDALAASGLAGTLDAPVVITAPGSLSPQAAAEIRRLRPSRALVMGGSLAISDACLGQVRSLVPDTRRVFGQAATDTAVEIYRAGSGWGRTAVVATSGGYWDALSVAPYAWARRAPIFLTGGDNRLGQPALAAIRSGGFSRVVIVGGSLAVSSDVERQLSGISVKRLWGQSALDTSAAIARWELSEGMSLQHMGVATADGYWDALAGAALCGKGNSVLVLVLGSDCRAFDAVYDRSKVRQGWVFGGEMAVSKAAWDHVTAR